MYSINDFVGIIQGINLDGVINEKEIGYLEGWLKANKELMCTNHQFELVELVEEALKDRIITVEERNQMICCIKKMLLDENEMIDKFHELLGIIDGIICDEIINDSEIEGLINWLDLYESELKKCEQSENICNVLRQVLKDRVVSQEEQILLKNSLQEQIKIVYLESQLEYIFEKIRNEKNYGIDLINLLDNKIAVHEIHKRAETELARSLNSYTNSIKNPEIIVVSLTLIALLNYDGNYYEGVREAYSDIYEKYSAQKIEGFIRSLLSRYVTKKESSDRGRLINFPLKNAMVPQFFLEDFFEFVFDIYKINFNYNLAEDLENELGFVYEGLRNSINSDENDISVSVTEQIDQSVQMTQKTYKLIATTKQLMLSDEGIKALIELSVRVIKLIDNRVYDKKIEICNSYLRHGFERWEEKYKPICNGKMRDANLSSRHKPKFVLLNNKKVALETPVVKVRDGYDYRKIKVQIINDGRIVYQNNRCDIRKIIGGYQINSERITLENPLGNVRYMVLIDNNVIYDSAETLFRKYIIFNESENEIFNNTDYKGTAFFFYRKEEKDIKKISETPYYLYGYRCIAVGDVVNIEDDVFEFSDVMKPGLYGELQDNCLIKDKNNYYKVYKEVAFFAFEVTNKYNSFEIIINNKKYELSEFEVQKRETQTRNRYLIDLKLDRAGIYFVEVNVFNEMERFELFKTSIAYDPFLQYKVEYASQDVFKVVVISELLEKSLNFEINSSMCGNELIKFKNEEKEYEYIIPFDFGVYKIDDGEWRTNEKEIWIDEINYDSILRLYDSNCTTLNVYDDKGKKMVENIKLQDRGYYKEAKISFLKSYAHDSSFVSMMFIANEKVKYNIRCCNKCVFDEKGTEVVSNDYPKGILVSPSYYGKYNVYYKVFDEAGELVYRSGLIKSRDVDLVQGYESFKKYRIDFYESKNELGLNKELPVYSCEKTFYANQDFKGRTIKIEEVSFNKFIAGRLIEKTVCVKNQYVHFDEMIDENAYQGRIVCGSKLGEWGLDRINPVYIEFAGGIIDDTVEVRITNQGDGLLLDVKNNCVLDSLYGTTAPDIYMYVLNLKEEMKNEKTQSGRKN